MFTREICMMLGRVLRTFPRSISLLADFVRSRSRNNRHRQGDYWSRGNFESRSRGLFRKRELERLKPQQPR